jgi:5-methylphenazine-1-carboxylate 1-monooxygenase
MSVLIAGAGIGGLTLALSLHQKRIPFHVFESVAALRPLGVGINLQPHAVRELIEMGLGDRLAKIGLRTREVAYYSAQGRHIWSEPRGLTAGYKWPQYSVHRGRLQMMLLAALTERAGPDVVTFGTSVLGWKTSTKGVQATLSGTKGGRAEGRLLIGADGINSTLRAVLHPDEGPPVWGGTIMWRGTTAGPRFLTGRTMVMAGRKACKFVVYPIADTPDGGSLINWVADLTFPPDYLWNRQDWNRAGRLTDFLPAFADWHFDWLDVPEVIRGADAIFEYPMVDRNPLEQWSHGPTTLLGDAAHAMYPIGSNGATQAIIDARVLTRCLLRHGQTADALQNYEAERRPATNAIVLANRGDGPDQILEHVAVRAPEGFDHIGDVMSQSELRDVAAGYKTVAGFDVDALNARASILD